MNFTTVFECLDVSIFKIIMVYLIAIICFILVAFVAFIWYRYEMKKKKKSRIRKYYLISGIISCIVASIFSLNGIIEAPIYKYNIHTQYVEGNTYVTEGYADVETFINEDDEEKIDSIAVNNIEFNTDSKYIYNYSDNHTLCVADEDYLRVTYVIYRNHNFIVKIEKANS